MKDDMVWNGNKCQPKSKHISQKRGGGRGANVEARFNSIIFLKKEKYSKQALHGHM